MFFGFNPGVALGLAGNSAKNAVQALAQAPMLGAAPAPNSPMATALSQLPANPPSRGGIWGRRGSSPPAGIGALMQRGGPFLGAGGMGMGPIPKYIASPATPQPAVPQPAILQNVPQTAAAFTPQANEMMSAMQGTPQTQMQLDTLRALMTPPPVQGLGVSAQTPQMAQMAQMLGTAPMSMSMPAQWNQPTPLQTASTPAQPQAQTQTQAQGQNMSSLLQGIGGLGNNMAQGQGTQTPATQAAGML